MTVAPRRSRASRCGAMDQFARKCPVRPVLGNGSMNFLKGSSSPPSAGIMVTVASLSPSSQCTDKTTGLSINARSLSSCACNKSINSDGGGSLGYTWKPCSRTDDHYLTHLYLL